MRKKTSKHPKGLTSFMDYSIHKDNRTIYLGESIDESATEMFLKGLFYLDMESDKPITIILNTPGGQDYHGLAIYDAIRQCRSDITIKVYGHCMSMGVIILQAAKKRVLSPNSYLMIHEGSWGFRGNTRDGITFAEHVKDLTKLMYKILNERTGISEKELKEMCVKDYFMTASEAVKKGFADEIEN